MKALDNLKEVIKKFETSTDGQVKLFSPLNSDPPKKRAPTHKNISLATEKMFQELGYSVFPRKKLGDFYTDLVCIRNRYDTVAVEVKPSNINEIRKAIGQLFTYMDWVHRTYLVIPLETGETSLDIDKLLMNTSFGLIYYSGYRDTCLLGKPPKVSYPDMVNLYDLIRRTSGYCWFCGRTFVEVPLPGDDFLKKIGFKKKDQIKICGYCSSIMIRIIASIGEEIFEKK